MEHSYVVGKVYRDRAGAKFEDDEFLRWFLYGKTIANSGGVRWRDFLSLNLVDRKTQRRIPAYFVLVTVRHHSQFQNPWNDEISTERIHYWGDAKRDSKKSEYSDFKGNQRLMAGFHAQSLGTEAIPPILHFTKFEAGWVQFNGLCWLADVNVRHFIEADRPIKNLILKLDVLDVEEVRLPWLHNRSTATTLEGINRDAPLVWANACSGALRLRGPGRLSSYALASGERALSESGDVLLAADFDPKNMEDARAKIMAGIFQRQGQKAFRHRLLEAYKNCCAITGCEVVHILEACHILPYKGHHTNHPQNGMLLRSDLHTLFDQGLIGVDPETLSVVISKELRGTEYEAYHGQSLKLPPEHKNRPSVEALRQHYLEMNQ